MKAKVAKMFEVSESQCLSAKSRVKGKTLVFSYFPEFPSNTWNEPYRIANKNFSHP